MKNMNIYLNTPEDAINFVSTVSKVPYEADLSYGHCMVDAKSILGVLGRGMRLKISSRVLFLCLLCIND